MTQVTAENVKKFLDSLCPLWHDGSTWREWLADLLITLIKEGEAFSGKRPNCDNSEWATVLADGLTVINPAIVQSQDEDGFPENIDWDLFHETFARVCYSVFGMSAANEGG